jgi:hypothetical protein
MIDEAVVNLPLPLIGGPPRYGVVRISVVGVANSVHAYCEGMMANATAGGTTLISYSANVGGGDTDGQLTVRYNGSTDRVMIYNRLGFTFVGLATATFTTVDA